MSSKNEKHKSVNSAQHLHEQNILEKFKEAVSDLEQNEETLMRYLRAREHDLPKAEEMLRQSISWRVNNNISGYLLWKPTPCLKDKYKITYEKAGMDYEGRPVFWVPVGDYLPRECIEDGNKEEIFKFAYHMLENALESSKTATGNQIVGVLEMQNLKLRTLMHIETLQVFYQAFQMLEQNYPEILSNLIIVNAPRIFSIIYNFIKPILSNHTMSKIEIYDSNKSKWMPRLLEIIPVESIPEEFKFTKN